MAGCVDTGEPRWMAGWVDGRTMDGDWWVMGARMWVGWMMGASGSSGWTGRARLLGLGCPGWTARVGLLGSFGAAALLGQGCSGWDELLGLGLGHSLGSGFCLDFWRG